VSNLTLLLGGVIIYARLNDTSYSLPPSLHFTFDDGTILSSGGGNAHPFRAQGLSLPPWKQTQCKYALIKAQELGNFSSYQTLIMDKNCV
jgi:hypothetical protein